jgi:cobaltochelatase CobN
MTHLKHLLRFLCLVSWVSFFLILAPLPAISAEIAFLVLDANSRVAGLAVEQLDLPIGIQLITTDEITAHPEQAKEDIEAAEIILVDVMGRELTSFVTQIDPGSKIIYALRGSLDDDPLKKKGFLFDEKVSAYYQHLCVKNIQNMLRLVVHRHTDRSIIYEPVIKKPASGLYHPDAGELFTRVDTYLSWQKQQPGFDPRNPTIGFCFFSSFLTPGQKEPIDYLIRRLESEGFNVLPCFGKEQEILSSFLLDKKETPRVNMILAFSFKFYNALTPELGKLLCKLNVPVISAVSLYKDRIDQWRKSPVGIDTVEVAWSLAIPEISGLVEPTVLSAKEKRVDTKTGRPYFLSCPVIENIDRLIPRLKKWIQLQQKPNEDKRVAILFYNHHQGKQNIGASYLNVFKSLELIMATLKEAGYTTGRPLSEAKIKKLILSSARNIGSWAPGELNKMVSTGTLIRLPVDTYNHWFESLPESFKEKVIEQWGEPGQSGIMKQDNDFIIPAVQVNNILLLPEPARGWGDDPMKLYHDTTLFPHHQYLAVYLWLSKEFKADAMIHLGTHATYEWTPGKQAGLSPSCSPEVLITDIPNLYPYIVDDVGEGIQAKRRGRGVIISHLTPTLKQADLTQEYRRMADLTNEYTLSRSMQSPTAMEKYRELVALARETGILADLKNSPPTPVNSQPDSDPDQLVHTLGHYLEEIRENLIPYGMHTFGISPGPDETFEMSGAIQKYNPELSQTDLSNRLARSGPDEMANLIQGLSGRYIPPGQGNDPVRNPESLPTGKNFYGFNPNKLPSPAAWNLGKKAAQQIINNHLNKNNAFPQKVAVILWAVESLRNEGVNEATIMYLVGTRPRWSKTGRVLGIDLISGKKLGRPRIDVMINASGLYRDLFPEKLTYLDQAIDLAGRQVDVENLIARHTAQIKTRLIKKGMDPGKADQMSRFRIFSETPGSYGNGVSEMASGSAKWDNPDKVVDVFENRMGFAFGQNKWGVRAKAVLKEQLSQVDVTVHSRSSNVYGLLDNDDMFQYLGGLSMAVRKESGKTPETLITQQQKKGRVQVEDMGKTLGREMRSRYLNPKWIQGMKAEDYAGAKAMSDYVEYLWGWNLTTPEKVDEAKWQQTYEVYVKDKYHLDMEQFFDRASPWALQSITARMLEVTRKGYWKPDQDVLKALAARYAKSIIQKGIACCDHTCNNPLLNQMVVSIISIPGVLSPDLVAQFKLAVEQMAKQPLDDQAADRKVLIEKLVEQLAAPAPANPAPATSGPSSSGQPSSKKSSVEASEQQDTSQMVEGYKMEKIQQKDDTTQMTSSGIEWMAVLAVLAIMGLASFGAARKN